MPGPRRQRRRRTRRGYKKRVGKTKGPTTKTLSKKIRNIENNLIELKYIDNYRTVVLNTGTFEAFGYDNFYDILPGETQNQRIGDNIMPTSMQMMAVIKNDGRLIDATGPAPPGPLIQRVRVIAFWDNQAQGSAPATPDIIDVSIISDPTLAPRNYKYINRFDFVWDKTYTFKSPTSVYTWTAGGVVTQYSDQVITKKKTFRFARKIRYVAGNGALADIQGNLFWIAMITNNDGPGNNEPPVVTCGTRLYYRDA